MLNPLATVTFDIERNTLPSNAVLLELLGLIKIGHLSGFNDRLENLVTEQQVIEQQSTNTESNYLEFLGFMKMLAKNVELTRLQTTIEQSIEFNGA